MKQEEDIKKTEMDPQTVPTEVTDINYTSS